MPTIALLGCTHIHTPNFAKKLAQREGMTVKWLFDEDRDAAKKRQEVCGGEIADSGQQLVTDDAVDAVVVCSETINHSAYVGAVVDAGKALFVEKPLGMNADEAEAMARQIREAGVIFQTGYFMRGQPEVRTVRKLVQDGTLGKVTRIRLSNVHSGALGDWFTPEWLWMTEPRQAGCGAFGDLGTHVLDLMLWIMDGQQVDAATAALGNAIAQYGDQLDEYGEGMVRFGSGAIGTIAGGWVDRANPNVLEVCGLEGHARITAGQLYVTSEALGLDGASPYGKDQLEPGLPHAFDLFLDAVEGKDAELVTPAEAAERNNVMEAMYEGARREVWIKP